MIRRLLLAAALSFGILLAVNVQTAQAATYYVDYVGGSDAYHGNAKTFTSGTTGPLQNAPGSNNCASYCATITLNPGDSVIFKGGVTWPFPNALMNLPYSGSAGNPIYYGVDQTWYTGGAWSRPIFDAEYMFSLVWTMSGKSYLTIDSLEFKRVMADDPNSGGLITGFNPDHIIMQNLYGHGWRMAGSGPRTDGAHGGILFGNYNVSSTCQTNYLNDSIIENSENSGTYTQNGLAVRQVCNLARDYIHDVSSATLQVLDIDTVTFENMGAPDNIGIDASLGDPYHTNIGYVDPQSVGACTGYIRNSHFKNVQSGAYAAYPLPNNGCTVYVYNNIFEGNFLNHEPIGVDPYDFGGSSGGSVVIANNQIYLEDSPSGLGAIHTVIRPEVKLVNFTSVNNYFIGDAMCTQDDANGSTVSGTILRETNLPNNGTCQLNSVAIAQEYLQVNLWEPQNDMGDTFGAGTNLSSIFTTTRTGATRTAPWDIGPWQYTPSTGSIWYVATNGSDGNPGTFLLPFLTVQYAESQAHCGDIIFLRGGTYGGSGENIIGVRSGDGLERCASWALPITVENYPGEQVIMSPNGANGWATNFGDSVAGADIYWKVIADDVGNFVLECLHCGSNNSVVAGNGSNVWLEKLEVRNSITSCILPAEESQYWTLIDLDVHTCGSTSTGDHGIYWFGDHLLIDGGTWHDNYNYGIQIFHSSGCLSPGDSNCSNYNVIRNARIYDNFTCTVSCAGGGGIIVSAGNYNLVYNNLIYNNLHAHGLDIDYRCGNCSAYNNTIYNNATTGIAIGQQAGATNTIVKNNIIYLNASTINDNGTSSVITPNYTSDPGFTDASAGDFTISITSGAINTGDNLTSLLITGLDVDFAGTARSSSNMYWDSGAYTIPSSTCTADHLSFTSQPTSSVLNASLGTVIVSILTAGGMVCTDSTAVVTLAKDSGATWGALNSSSSLSGAAVAGVFTRSDLYVSGNAGNGSIVATSPFVTGANSDPITISNVAVGIGGGVIKLHGGKH